MPLVDQMLKSECEPSRRVDLSKQALAPAFVGVPRDQVHEIRSRILRGGIEHLEGGFGATLDVVPAAPESNLDRQDPVHIGLEESVEDQQPLGGVGIRESSTIETVGL